MKPLLLALIFIITILDSYFYGRGLEPYQLVFEPLIIPSILAYYLLSSKRKDRFILIAFFLVCMGDLLLLIEWGSFFLQWAVFSYWLMQLSFIKVYRGYQFQYSFNTHLLGLLFWGSYLVVFLNHVYSSLGNMKIHGVVYGVTLSAFGSIAVMVMLKKVSKKNIFLVLGLLIFSIRDVFLTYNKKYFNEEVFTFSIPILHGIGFFIIIKAFLYYEQDVLSGDYEKS